MPQTPATEQETPTLAAGTLLASPQELAARLPAAQAPHATDAITRASARFEEAIGYPMAFIEDDIVTLSGDGGERLLLPAGPVVGLPTVEVDGEPVEVRCNRRAGILRRPGGACWPRDYDNVEVTYSHGYAAIPRSVQDAVLEQAEAIANAMAGIASRTAGAESVTFLSSSTVGVTQRWVDTVDAYRLRGDA